MRHLMLPLIVLFALEGAFAQTAPQSGSNHGLALILSRETEPADSPKLKACLTNHQPLACVLLTVTLKNEGKEDFLSMWSTCYPESFIFAFDFKKSDGSWEKFPALYRQWNCEATIGYDRLVFHGKSYNWNFRSAESAHDTAFLAKAPETTGSTGSTEHVPFLGPLTIRARQGVGCVAAVYVGEEVRIGPLSDFTCKKEAGQNIEVQSNELELTAGPAVN